MKTLVIAEIGCNFESLKDIKESIKVIKDLGAVPKLQAFRADKLCSKTRDPKQYDTLCHYELPDSYILEAGVMGAFFSVFDLEMIGFLENNVNPAMYKISAPDCNYMALIHSALETKKRVIVSETVSYPAQGRWEGAEYLYCVSAYPADAMMLHRMKDYAGISDHSTSVIVPALSIMNGATIVEKHFKLRDMNTPDSLHALLPERFKQMIELIEETEQHLVYDSDTHDQEERNLIRARRGHDLLRPLD